jgi:hypothetical protein
MSDMINAYNRQKSIGLQQSVNEWRAHSARQDQEIARLKAEIDVRKGHYLGLEAERDYLLEMLDNAYGGAESNPARQTASDSIRIPNGPRKGEFIQARDRIYLARLKRFISEKASYLGSWKDLIRDNYIFD